MEAGSLASGAHAAPNLCSVLAGESYRLEQADPVWCMGFDQGSGTTGWATLSSPRLLLIYFTIIT